MKLLTKENPRKISLKALRLNQPALESADSHPKAPSAVFGLAGAKRFARQKTPDMPSSRALSVAGEQPVQRQASDGGVEVFERPDGG